MRCLIIHNPASGPSSDEIYAFTHALAQGGDEVVMRFIGDGMEPEDAVADVREFDRVVISGGDGTVSNVLDQMRGCGVPTLVFPSGTACLFFNNIGNAPEAAALAKACRAGRTVKVDMGELFWLDETGNAPRHGREPLAASVPYWLSSASVAAARPLPSCSASAACFKPSANGRFDWPGNHTSPALRRSCR